MKPSCRFCAALALLAWPLAGGGAELSPVAYQPLRIDQTWKPAFPVEATDLDLTRGNANVIVTIDAAGRLTDSLVVAYRHSAFAAMAVLAVKRWKYEPARRDGQPLATTQEVVFHFEQEGMVLVTLTPSELIESHMRSMSPEGASYRAYTLNEIDRALTMTHSVLPAYPPELRARGIRGTVTLQYYVDENGRVRMPMVINRAPPELAGLALEAAEQWQFDPPTRHGRPVLVRVSQSIRFNSDK